MAESDEANGGEGGRWRRILSTTMSRQQLPDLARSRAASCVVEGELYVFGGGAVGGSVQQDFLKYSFKRGSWEEVQVLSDIKPRARSYCGGFAVCENNLTIYMFGGYSVGCKS